MLQASQVRGQTAGWVREQRAYVFGMYAYAYWLPCPPGGPFNLTVRVYQPEQAMLDGHTENRLVVQAGTYQVPPIRKMGQ